MKLPNFLLSLMIMILILAVASISASPPIKDSSQTTAISIFSPEQVVPKPTKTERSSYTTVSVGSQCEQDTYNNTIFEAQLNGVKPAIVIRS